MYDPSVGRWFEEDPQGFAAGDPNLFRYVKNSPTNHTDPSGLAPPDPAEEVKTKIYDNEPKGKVNPGDIWLQKDSDVIVGGGMLVKGASIQHTIIDGKDTYNLTVTGRHVTIYGDRITPKIWAKPSAAFSKAMIDFAEAQADQIRAQIEQYEADLKKIVEARIANVKQIKDLEENLVFALI